MAALKAAMEEARRGAEVLEGRTPDSGGTLRRKEIQAVARRNRDNPLERREEGDHRLPQDRRATPKEDVLLLRETRGGTAVPAAGNVVNARLK